jgi:hypothetical protein
MVKIICIVQAHKNKLIKALKLNLTFILHCFKLDKILTRKKKIIGKSLFEIVYLCSKNISSNLIGCKKELNNQ